MQVPASGSGSLVFRIDPLAPAAEVLKEHDVVMEIEVRRPAVVRAAQVTRCEVMCICTTAASAATHPSLHGPHTACAHAPQGVPIADDGTVEFRNEERVEFTHIVRSKHIGASRRLLPIPAARHGSPTPRTALPATCRPDSPAQPAQRLPMPHQLHACQPAQVTAHRSVSGLAQARCGVLLPAEEWLNVKVLREGEMRDLRYRLNLRRPLVPVLAGVDSWSTPTEARMRSAAALSHPGIFYLPTPGSSTALGSTCCTVAPTAGTAGDDTAVACRPPLAQAGARADPGAGGRVPRARGRAGQHWTQSVLNHCTLTVLLPTAGCLRQPEGPARSVVARLAEAGRS